MQSGWMNRRSFDSPPESVLREVHAQRFGGLAQDDMTISLALVRSGDLEVVFEQA